VENRASQHMMGMRSMFLSFSKINSNCYVGCVASTIHAVKGVGCVIYQLELGGFLELAKVLFAPKILVNLLSVSSLEVDGCGFLFFHGLVFLYPKGATPDKIIFLGV
jgi:hypothetical protein